MAAEDTPHEDERQPMLLMLTELVTNAVRHGEARGAAAAAWP